MPTSSIPRPSRHLPFQLEKQLPNFRSQKMNPGLRPNLHGQFVQHSQCLEEVGNFDWRPTQTERARNCNKKRLPHSRHPNAMRSDKNRSDGCHDGNPRLRATREPWVDINLRTRKSNEDHELVCSTNNDVRQARRQIGSHQGSLSSTSSALFRKLSPSPKPQTCFPETKDSIRPRSMRSLRPLVNRKATPDFNSMEVKEKDEENAGLQIIQFCDLATPGSMTTKRFSGRHTFVSSWSPRSVTQQLHRSCGSKHTNVLKISLVDLSFGDSSFLEDMKKEARIAVELRHPNICELRGVVRESKYFGLAYEFCGRGLLSSLIFDRTMSYRVITIARDVVHGMAYLHSRRIIHRDLKPSNILLTSDLKAKVGELGMCVVNEGQKLTAETGTYRYMSPEIIRHESYDFPTDVYSFGVCLWQLITRDIPFATRTPLQAAYSVAEGQRPSIPETVPSDIQEIISACWDEVPSFRPSFAKLVQLMEKRQGLVYPILPSLELGRSKEKSQNAEEGSASNTATDLAFQEGGYLDHDNLCIGGDGIGLEI